MAIAVNEIENIFLKYNYTKSKHSTYHKNTDIKGLSLWASTSDYNNQTLLTMGAVSTTVNRFALATLKKASEGRVKPQFPAYIGPPIYIPLHEYIYDDSVLVDLSDKITNFEKDYYHFSLEDWCSLAAQSPLPSSELLLPAYYVQSNQRENFFNWTNNFVSEHTPKDIKLYYKELGSQLAKK